MSFFFLLACPTGLEGRKSHLALYVVRNGGCGKSERKEEDDCIKQSSLLMGLETRPCRGCCGVMVPPPPLFKLLFSHPSSLLLFFFFCVDSCYLSSLPIHTSWQSLTLCTAKKKKNYRFFSLLHAQEAPKRLLYRIVFGARVPLACLRLSVIVLLSQFREKEDEEININPMNVTQRQPILLLTL